MENQDWSVRITETIMQNPKPLLVWHYETGCVLKAVAQVWLKTGNHRYFDFVKEMMDALVEPDGRIKGYEIEEYNLDQINTGKVLLMLFNKTGDSKYRTGIELLMSQLKDHPRTHEGGFWHKKIYPYQMWLDGIYMASPFLAEYAQVFDQPQLFDDVAGQILMIVKHTRDPITGLLYHAWDESKAQRWADPKTGCSPHFWGRAIGWFLMALVDVLDFLPVNHQSRNEIIGIFSSVMKAVTSMQDPSTGLWYQILDQGERDGNYLEASASAMFIYALLKGVRLRYLDQRFCEPAYKGYHGILSHLVGIGADGTVELHNTCGSAGLGGDPYRDGSYDYYVNETVKVNDPKGVASLILASVEYEMVSENDEIPNFES